MKVTAMMHHRPDQLRRDESGAVAIVVALLLTSFVLIAAIVVDLGLLRSDRVQMNSVSDMATAAAVSIYEPGDQGGPQAACLAALRYADANISGADFLDAAEVVASCADAFPSTASCRDLDPGGQTASYRDGDYELSITIPVPNGSNLLQPFDHEGYDGVPCQRVGVSLSRTSTPVFAGFVGNDPRTISAATVGRGGAVPDDEDFASLIILRPTGCGTIATDGNPTLIEVEGVNFGGTYFPGTIVVDTSTACPSPASGRVFEPSNGSRPGIRASDGIFSNALRLSRPRVLHSNAALTIDAGTTGSVVAGRPITRLNVDDRYNCIDPYPAGPNWSPASWTQLVEADGGPGATPRCDTDEDFASELPYVQLLHAAYQDLTAATARSQGWSIFPDDLADEDAACRASGGNRTDFTLGPDDETGDGDGSRWFIDCPGTNPNNTLQPDGLEFLGVDVVVSRAQIEVTDSIVVTGSDQGAVLYLQTGNFERSSNTSTVELRDTFVYVDSGAVQFGSSSATPLIWEAPIDNEPCESYTDSPTGAPPAACFAPLALWSNGSGLHNMSGGVQLNIAGSFFTPNARFRLGGGNDQTLDKAQFFTGSLTAAGNSVVTMKPNPETNIPTPPPAPRILLR